MKNKIEQINQLCFLFFKSASNYFQSAPKLLHNLKDLPHYSLALLYAITGAVNAPENILPKIKAIIKNIITSEGNAYVIPLLKLGIEIYFGIRVISGAPAGVDEVNQDGQLKKKRYRLTAENIERIKIYAQSLVNGINKGDRIETVAQILHQHYIPQSTVCTLCSRLNAEVKRILEEEALLKAQKK